MRHNKKHGMKLGTDSSHTKAMKRSLTCALLENDRIKTTVQRAKAIRPEVDAVITWAKRGDIAARRQAIAKIGDAELVREVFEKAEQGMWADRNGGYTRIMRLGRRKGDGAEMVLIELVNEPVQPKKASKKATATKVEKVVEEAPADEAPAAEEEATEAPVEEAAEVEAEAEPEAEATEEAPAEEAKDKAE